jgi:hypothetical protein
MNSRWVLAGFGALAACGARTTLRDSDGTSDGAAGGGEPVPPCERAELVSGLAQPFYLTSDGADLYWIDEGEPGTIGDSSLEHFAKATGETVLHANIAAGGDVKAADGRLYFTEIPTGTLFACDAPSCPTLEPILVRPDDPPILIDVGATDIYTFTYHALIRCSKPSCTDAETLAASSYGALAMTADESFVYWIDATPPVTVYRCAKPSCTGGPKKLASDFATPPLGIAVDGTRLFLSIGGAVMAEDDDGSIVSCPKSGCTDAPTVLASGLHHPVVIRVDEARAYWIDEGSSKKNFTDGDVSACDKAGCAAPDVLAGDQLLPTGLTLGPGCVYWATNARYTQPPPPGVTAAIEQAPKRSKQP